MRCADPVWISTDLREGQGTLLVVGPVSVLVFSERMGWKGWLGLGLGALALALMD